MFKKERWSCGRRRRKRRESKKVNLIAEAAAQEADSGAAASAQVLKDHKNLDTKKNVRKIKT